MVRQHFQSTSNISLRVTRFSDLFSRPINTAQVCIFIPSTIPLRLSIKNNVHTTYKLYFQSKLGNYWVWLLYSILYCTQESNLHLSYEYERSDENYCGYHCIIYTLNHYAYLNNKKKAYTYTDFVGSKLYFFTTTTRAIAYNEC